MSGVTEFTSRCSSLRHDLSELRNFDGSYRKVQVERTSNIGTADQTGTVSRDAELSPKAGQQGAESVDTVRDLRMPYASPGA